MADDTGTTSENETGEQIDLSAAFGQFTAYIHQIHKAGMARLDQMTRETADGLDKIQFGTVIHEAMEKLVADEIMVTEDETTACGCDPDRIENDEVAADEHERLHLGDRTVQMVTEAKTLERVQGYPSQQIFVVDQGCFYEWQAFVEEPAGAGQWVRVE